MRYFYHDIKKALVLLMFVICAFYSQAQDQQFTQFYSAPLYLNPAFAGTSMESRVALNYRNQWPSIPGAFVSYNVSYDRFFDGFNSGLGIIVSHDKAGTGAMTYSGVAAMYTYEVKLSRKLSFRPSVQMGLGMVQLDINRLTFGDQLARGMESGTIDPDRNSFQNGNSNYPDFASGFLLFSKKFWAGAALHHMNKPNYSLLQRDSRMPAKFSAHGGVRFKPVKYSSLQNRQYIVAAFNYKAQGKYDQLDLGFYYEYDPLTIGFWYRGLPLLKSNHFGMINHDAVAIVVGYQINNVKIGYSYDLTISDIATNTGGAHEISIVSEFISKKKKKSKRRVIPCAKF